MEKRSHSISLALTKTEISSNDSVLIGFPNDSSQQVLVHKLVRKMRRKTALTKQQTGHGNQKRIPDRT
jgi:hypothetical protein